MTIIKNVTDFPENFFGFHPEDLSPDEKNRPLGKIFIKLQKLRNDLGLKCILIPGFAFKSISIINIEQDENYQPITQSSTIHLPTQQESCETKDQLQNRTGTCRKQYCSTQSRNQYLLTLCRSIPTAVECSSLFLHESQPK